MLGDVAGLSMVKLIFYGGVNEIGGNKILLEDKDELVERVNYIQPKRAFAVHTENPKLFKSYCGNMQMIEQEKEYDLK
jgi:mRNA degradation ribonuclease J1/J2